MPGLCAWVWVEATSITVPNTDPEWTSSIKVSKIGIPALCPSTGACMARLSFQQDTSGTKRSIKSCKPSTFWWSYRQIPHSRGSITLFLRMLATAMGFVPVSWKVLTYPFSLIDRGNWLWATAGNGKGCLSPSFNCYMHRTHFTWPEVYKSTSTGSPFLDLL